MKKNLILRDVFSPVYEFENNFEKMVKNFFKDDLFGGLDLSNSLNNSDLFAEDWEIAQFWAQKKLAELELFADKNKDEIKNLGKQFGIVTMNSSLIVLENVSDYVKYEITPPSELKTEYDKQMKNVFAQRENRVNNLMRRAESMTENLKNWWKTDFTIECFIFFL